MPYSQRGDALEDMVRELDVLPDKILHEGKQIVSKGMLNIKRGAQQRVREMKATHLPHLPRSFNYDVTVTGGRVITGEAGADMDKLQGKLDIYIENGTAHTPANAHWTRALDAEAPNFERYAEDYLARLLQ